MKRTLLFALLIISLFAAPTTALAQGPGDGRPTGNPPGGLPGWAAQSAYPGPNATSQPDTRCFDNQAEWSWLEWVATQLGGFVVYEPHGVHMRLGLQREGKLVQLNLITDSDECRYIQVVFPAID